MVTYSAPFVIRGFSDGCYSVGSLTVIEELTEFLIKDPEIPTLFQTTDTPFARVLWTALLYSDFFPGGLKGVGVKRLA